MLAIFGVFDTTGSHMVRVPDNDRFELRLADGAVGGQVVTGFFHLRRSRNCSQRKARKKARKQGVLESFIVSSRDDLQPNSDGLHL